jgi:hypothetical protein
MNPKLRNRCDDARRVGFRIAIACVRIQAEVNGVPGAFGGVVLTPASECLNLQGQEISMGAISMWSDHGAPARGRWWKTRSRRSTRSSTGLKILLAAGVLVAGVIGISGVYPKVIDPEWVQGAGAYASRVSAPDARTTTPDAKITRRSDSPASIQAPSRSIALTTSEAPVATPGSAAVVPTPRAAAPASKPLPQAAPLAVAETADAAVNADAPPTPAPTVAAKPAAPVVKRRVVSRVAHPRRGTFTFGPFAFGGSPFRM